MCHYSYTKFGTFFVPLGMYVVHDCCKRPCHFTGSMTSPQEDRLLEYLFDPKYQTNNLMTLPISNLNETINVTVTLGLLKLIALVKSKDFVSHNVV